MNQYTHQGVKGLDSVLKVQMFGEFSILANGKSISNHDNRSHKIWSLLAYLIINHNKVVKQNELMQILWDEDDRGVNPVGALKTLFYRARLELDNLWEGAGKQLILSQGNGYTWNNDFAMTLDVEDFETLSEKLESAPEPDLEDAVQLIQLYHGEFLERLSAELWVMPVAAYYHNTYTLHLLQVLPTLLEAGRYEEVMELCQVATALEPYSEAIHRYYMHACINAGQQKRAVELYQKLSDRLLSELGVLPSEETREIYHEAIKRNNDHILTVEMLQTQLREKESPPGALICEYDFFRILHYSMARSMLRNGIAVHMALLSISGKRDAELSTKKREKVMANMEDVIRYSLRRGDTAARCSATQYVIMLPRANYENSCLVCDRILRAYYHKYSRMDAEIRYEVFPMQPDDKENFQWVRETFTN